MPKPLALIAVTTVFTVVSVAPAHATRKPPILPERPEVAELQEQLRDPKVPAVAYWDAVAVCESSLNGRTARWDDGGQWAGGLGIYTKGEFGDPDMGTWERWGGEDFAPSPGEANRLQQIVVANRIASKGWSTVVRRDPDWAKRKGVPVIYEWHKGPAGYQGWGCIANRRWLQPKSWMRRFRERQP